MSLSTLQATRAQKLRDITALGLRPLDLNLFSPDTVETLRSMGESYTREELEERQYQVKAVGRIMAMRVQGKLGFVDIVQDGHRIQLFLRQNALPETSWTLLTLLDVGDHVAVEGVLMRTRPQPTNNGELSIGVAALHFLNKALSPLPDKVAGLVDVELRHRMRYLDLVMSSEVTERFRERSRIVAAVRTYMERGDFMEVETPMFHPVSGGANARPFTTHHNALDTDFNLRIAPELYLKRLIVGGYDRVYELNRNFRNEGIDQTHNPEFTMLECYQAYADYNSAMATVEGLITSVASTLHRRNFNGINFGVWSRQSLRTMVEVWTGRTDLTPEEMVTIFEDELESTLIQPTIVYDFPVSVSPLAKEKPNDPGWAERFEVYIGGMEIANAFSELTDPDEQLRRFEQQVANHADETREIDHDYIRALSYGMPPTAGLGIGIDRLVMLLTGQTSIREVILFPSMRKENFSE